MNHFFPNASRPTPLPNSGEADDLDPLERLVAPCRRRHVLQSVRQQTLVSYIALRAPRVMSQSDRQETLVSYISLRASRVMRKHVGMRGVGRMKAHEPMVRRVRCIQLNEHNINAFIPMQK
jgi:hypothetical protein